MLTVRHRANLLAAIGDRLHLANLRPIDTRAGAGRRQRLRVCRRRQQPIARFAWPPQKPGAEILAVVIPFIGIALAGFALLAGLVLRYMRNTAATIAAGENRLRYLALHDPLCGLPNRNFFGERLEAVIADVKRGGAPAAVFYIDLDHFKDVNDTLGHPIGDELIRNVTLRLSRTCAATIWSRASAATNSPSSPRGLGPCRAADDRRAASSRRCARPIRSAATPS